MTLTFDCRPIHKGAFSGDAAYFTHDEADAVAWSIANATRDREQVTIEVTAPGDVSTFAIRHFQFGGIDTGWLCWRDGDRVSTRSLDVLFGERVAS